MGRKALNRTEEELKKMNRVRAQRYYERHSDKVKRNNLNRYYEKKQLGYCLRDYKSC